MSTQDKDLIAELRRVRDMLMDADYYEAKPHKAAGDLIEVIDALDEAIEAATEELERERRRGAARQRFVAETAQHNEQLLDERDAALAAVERARQAEAELRDVLRVDIPSLKAERDAALARIAELEQSLRSESLARGVDATLLREYERRFAEAAKLHRPRKHWNSDREYVFVCDECTRINRYGIAQWPCPTAVSLGLNEGESE